MRTVRVLSVLTAAVLALGGCTNARSAGPSVAHPASVVRTAGSPPAVSPSLSSTPSATPQPRRSIVSTPTRAVPRKPVRVVKARPTGPAVDPLTGGRPSRNPVIAVKIDNTFFDVRQFGVADADVVFVEQVEGGLTRLIAVYHTTFPNEVGPVRSVRSTDAQLLPVFGRPALVFAGGAGGPMADLRSTPVIDTSTLTDAYFRSDAAYGTYNLHADLTRIAATAVGMTPARNVGFTFAASSPLVAAGRPVSTIHLVMEAGTVDFSFRAGRFVRTMDGAEVFDYQGRSEAADNVLVQNVVDQPDGTVDSIGSPSYLSRTVGSGTVTLFRDGHAIPGTWKRASATAPFVYTAAGGRPLPFTPGKTWIALAPQTAQLTVG